MNLAEKIRIEIRKFCLLNLSVSDVPTLIYLFVKIVGCSFLKDTLVAACFPENEILFTKQKTLKRMQTTAFDGNWIDGRQASSNGSSRSTSKSELVEFAGQAGTLLTDSSIGLVTRICNSIQVIAINIIKIITHKIRAIICTISSLLLLKDCLIYTVLLIGYIFNQSEDSIVKLKDSYS